MRRHWIGLALVAGVAACAENSAGPSGDVSVLTDLVVTEGIPTPLRTYRERPVLSVAGGAVSSSVGGSVSTPVSLMASTCASGSSQDITISYSITGNQVGTATFKVNTKWTYNGTGWTGSVPTTITVPPRGPSTPATIRVVTVTVENGSTAGSGSASFTVPAFDLTNSNATGAKLSFSGDEISTVFVEFTSCAVANTAPVLTLPLGLTVEATSSAGAAVDFAAQVLASDAEQGDLSGSVVCTPASGSTFALGTTSVNCSVTDAGGLSASGDFDVTVVDTTPAFFTSFPTTTLNLTAADKNGAALDLSGLGLAAEDVGHVSEPATIDCDYDGSPIAIGATLTVSCTTSDAIGNQSAESSFDVFVGLDLSANCGFETPLRMSAPFSAHKRGSTIPHKICPPAYADGTPATDLADGLRLVLDYLGGSGTDDVEANDNSTGSTAWRYDPVEGHYIFNLKSEKNWAEGSWQTTVSYAGIALASTSFVLKR